MNAPSSSALVLGGGGSAGNAWLIGVIAGLHAAGLDVTDADLIIGTSAGATAAAQITAADPAELFDDILSTAHSAALHRPGPLGTMVDHLTRTNEIIAASSDLVDMRRRMAASARELDAASDGSGHARWRAVVAGRLPSQVWPDRDILLTAVDAQTGEPVEFGRHSGVDLVDAVAASTAGGPPYRIGSTLYVDGGYRRSSENADLAAGYGRVLVLSPLGGRTRHPADWGSDLATAVEELRDQGSAVETVLPDRASLEAFGDSMMNLATRPASARAGFAQGSALAETLTGFWRIPASGPTVGA